MSYLAQLDKAGAVVRVVVADSAEWCADNLGGTWLEVADPYDPKDARTYPGPGYGYDEKHPQRFAVVADALASISPDALVFHKGTIARADTVPELSAKLEQITADERITP